MQMSRSIFAKYRYANELRYLWSYPAEVHPIFRRYSHIISAVNAHRQWYCNSFWTILQRMQVPDIFHKLIDCHGNVPRQIGKQGTGLSSLLKALSYGEKVAKHRSSISWDIPLNTRVFLACRTNKKFTNEPRFLWSYWNKVHEIFTGYNGIIYAANAHIEVAISQSVSECQSDKCKGVGNFATKFVAMATLLDESEKPRRIEKTHANTFHLVLISWKSVQ